MDGQQNVNICVRNLDTKRDVYTRILGAVYNNEKQNWRILTNKEINAIVKKNPP
jgi:hypothetical protein